MNEHRIAELRETIHNSKIQTWGLDADDAAEMLTEVERLRKLVQRAYEEGWIYGQHAEADDTFSEKWHASESRKALKK